MNADQEEESDEMEEVTLLEVDEDEDALELMDGRRLKVSPGDMPTALLWLPTATLEIRETGDGMFDLLVKLQGTEQVVRARWG